ncbi:MAG TPA: hypothetical protein DCZ13_07970 [Porticoccaceae bacterium]|nr:hypothetical protein [Porticoccaceae bacterium]
MHSEVDFSRLICSSTVKKPRYSETQILKILNEAGTPVPELCRTYRKTNASFIKWRAKHGSMEASDMVRR